MEKLRIIKGKILKVEKCVGRNTSICDIQLPSQMKFYFRLWLVICVNLLVQVRYISAQTIK